MQEIDNFAAVFLVLVRLELTVFWYTWFSHVNKGTEELSRLDKTNNSFYCVSRSIVSIQLD